MTTMKSSSRYYSTTSYCSSQAGPPPHPHPLSPPPAQVLAAHVGATPELLQVEVAAVDQRLLLLHSRKSTASAPGNVQGSSAKGKAKRDAVEGGHVAADHSHVVDDDAQIWQCACGR